jgi:hypothetical protein
VLSAAPPEDVPEGLGRVGAAGKAASVVRMAEAVLDICLAKLRALAHSKANLPDSLAQLSLALSIGFGRQARQGQYHRDSGKNGLRHGTPPIMKTLNH